MGNIGNSKHTSYAVFILAILLLIALIYRQQRPPKVQEGFINEIANAVKSAVNKAVDGVKRGFEKMLDELKKAFDAVKRKVTRIIDDIVDAFASIQHQFEVLPIRGKRIRSGFEKSGKALVMEFDNLGIALKTGFDDTFELIGDSGTMSIEYVLCALDKLGNLPMCILFYIFDLFRMVFGWFFRSLVCAIELYFDSKRRFNVDLNAGIDKGKEKLKKLDKYIKDFTGYSFLSYPEYIEDRCYRCKMKVTAKQVAEQANQVSYDFNHRLPELMKAPAYMFREAGNDFRDVFSADL